MRTTPFRPEIKQNLLPPIRRVSTSPTQLRKEFFPLIGFTRGFGYLDELVAQAGDWVREGETVGRVGETGSISGPGLYFEIRHRSVPVDPLDWLRPR